MVKLKKILEALDALTKEIHEYKERNEKPSKTRKKSTKLTLEQQISSQLHNHGIPAHLRGYTFVSYAISLVSKNNSPMYSITMWLYPAIAMKYATTTTKVERAIRHSILLAWKRGKLEDYTSKPPTNSEFIATVVEKLKMEV